MKVSFWFAVCCSSTLSLKLRLSTVLFRQPSETNTEERREERKGERERKTAEGREKQRKQQGNLRLRDRGSAEGVRGKKVKKRENGKSKPFRNTE